MKKLVCGVGINDGTCPYYEDGSKKPHKIYEKWRGMLRRCYNTPNNTRNQAYRGCTVSEDWLLYSNFYKWASSQDYANKDLDKDLLIEGNKIYSKDNCVLISSSLNSFLRISKNTRGNQPLGVSIEALAKTKIYRSGIKAKKSDGKIRRKFLGCFDTAMEAHKSWQIAKKDLAIEFRNKETDIKVIEGLDRIINKLQYQIDNGMETIDL